MIATIVVCSYAAALVALTDQLRRPQSAWVAADRDRGFWTGMTIVLGLFACGAIIAIVHLLGVLPRFAGSDGVDGAFRKHP